MSEGTGLSLRGLDTAAELEAWLPAALAMHGPPLMFVICMLSCLALPVPASVAMLAAGTLAAEGGMSLWSIALACWAGAVVGDQIAFAIGRAGRGPLVRWLDRAPKRHAARLRAEDWTRRRGGPGVLLSRWPVSPLGPYVNFAAGAAGFHWSRFLAWDIPGEAIWVAVNLGAGYLFADQITAVYMVAHEAAGLLLLAAAILGIAFWRRRVLERRAEDETGTATD